MKFDEYKKKVEETLQSPLSVDSPETLFKETAVIESLSYLAVKISAIAEKTLSGLNDTLRNQKLEKLPTLSGTQMEKTIQLEAALSSLLKEIEDAEAEMRYWKSISKLIENKVSLSQSILSNISSQIKANLYVNNIK